MATPSVSETMRRLFNKKIERGHLQFKSVMMTGFKGLYQRENCFIALHILA